MQCSVSLPSFRKKKALSERKRGVSTAIHNPKSFLYLEPEVFLTLVLVFSLPCNKANLDLLYINDMNSCLNDNI